MNINSSIEKHDLSMLTVVLVFTYMSNSSSRKSGGGSSSSSSSSGSSSSSSKAMLVITVAMIRIRVVLLDRSTSE